MSAWTKLNRIRDAVAPRPLYVPMRDEPRGAFTSRTYLIDMSVLYPRLYKAVQQEQEMTSKDNQTSEHELPSVIARMAQKLVVECLDTNRADRAVGSLIGLTLGDAIGAPLEFLPAGCCSSASCVKLSNATGTPLVYENEYNKFYLARGQWTDDASMALCLADSLLERSRPTQEDADGASAYDGSDCRCRYLMWWSYGYNNAFRFDKQRRGKSSGAGSVGLGGNIASSLNEVASFGGTLATALRAARSVDNAADKKDRPTVPPRFTSKGEDAGNGSIMRLAAIPIRYHKNIYKAMIYAAEQSYSTHPGGDAAVCCMFMTYFQVKAIHRTNESQSLQDFLCCDVIPSFLDAVENAHVGGDTFARLVRSTSTGLAKLRALLNSQPPSAKEGCWGWKVDVSVNYCDIIATTLTARGHSYNGYPVDAGYFGSYCMDGLSMGLWALYHSRSILDCLIKTANLLGDADTTSAISGQLAGSFYGYRSIFQPNKDLAGLVSNTNNEELEKNVGKALLEQWLRRWDPYSEIELRALLLFGDGEKDGEPAESAALSPSATTKGQR